jgi:hypothetical protein
MTIPCFVTRLLANMSGKPVVIPVIPSLDQVSQGRASLRDVCVVGRG